MIKKIINKIKNFFKTSNEVASSYTQKEEEKINIQDNSTIENNDDFLCSNCKTPLVGKESAEDEEGFKYICCDNCNWVDKVKNNKVYEKQLSILEVTKAFELFKRNGINVSSYSREENGEKIKF